MVRSRTVVAENTTVQGCAALLNQWLQNLLEQSCRRGQGEARGPFHLSSHRDVPHSCPFQQELHAQVVETAMSVHHHSLTRLPNHAYASHQHKLQTRMLM